MDTNRGQTTLDFAAGISLFLLVIISTVAMFPTIFGPFSDAGDEHAITANRVADRLATDLLVGSAHTARLGVNCTKEFFDADGSAPADCRYEADGADRHRALGVLPRRQVNITINDGTGVRVLAGQRLAVGPTPAASATPIVARRTVLLDGNELRLVARVW